MSPKKKKKQLKKSLAVQKEHIDEWLVLLFRFSKSWFLYKSVFLQYKCAKKFLSKIKSFKNDKHDLILT